MSKLTIEEFQSLLEREFIQFAVCIEIFDDSHKDKYINKMREHYNKITDISGKLGSPNIFTNKELLDMNVSRVLPAYGAPEFIYRTPEAKESFGTVVKLTTFKYNTEAEFVGNGMDIEKVTILKNFVNTNVLQVQFKDGLIDEYPYDHFLCPVNQDNIYSQISKFLS